MEAAHAPPPRFFRTLTHEPTPQVGFSNVGLAVLTGPNTSAFGCAAGVSRPSPSLRPATSCAPPSFASVLIDAASGDVTVTALSLQGVAATATSAALRGPAELGAPACPFAANASTPAACPAAFNATQLAALLGGGFSIVLALPSGELRGQVFFPSLVGAPTFSAVQSAGGNATTSCVGRARNCIWVFKDT